MGLVRRVAAQKYDVSYLLVSELTKPLVNQTWIHLSGDSGATVNRGAAGTIAELQATISNGTSAIASSVAKLRFTFYNGLETGVGYQEDMYREIDVSGTVTIPEPGTLTLLAMGLPGLLAYAWRKRR